MKILVLVVLSSAVLFAGCDTTSLPDEVSDVVSDEVLQRFEAAGLAVYRGTNPPRLGPAYLGATLQVIHDDAGGSGMTINNTLFLFANQDGDEIDIETQDQVNDNVTAGSGHISGSGRCFTTFVQMQGWWEQDCEYRWASLLSGCVDSLLNYDGVEDFQWGTIMQWKEGPNCTVVVDVDNLRVFAETDGYLEPQDE